MFINVYRNRNEIPVIEVIGGILWRCENYNVWVVLILCHCPLIGSKKIN